MTTRIIVAAAMVALSACGGATLEQTWEAAEAALRRGRMDDVGRFVQEGLEQTRSDPKSVWAWRFRLLEAEVQLSRSVAAAQPTLDSAVPEGAEFASVRGRQRLLRARAEVLQGALEQAQAELAEAVAAAPADRELRFDSELLASQIRYRTGQWTAAEAGLQAMVSEARIAGDHHRQAQALNNLGMGLVVRGRFDEALPWFERVLDFPDLADTTIVGQALNNAGICYARLGQFERAVVSQQQAVAIHEGGRRQDYAQALGELGSTFLLQDDLARGMPYLKRALDIARDAELTGDAALWARNLAAASVALGQWDAAARFNEEATRFAPGGARRWFARVTDAQIAAGRGQAEDATRLFREALDAPDQAPAIRWMAYDGLARLAVAAGRPDEAARQYEAALATVEQTRSALLKADYRISFTTRLVFFYRGYVELLMDQGQTARALEVADSSRARVLAERQAVAAPSARARAGVLQRLARDARATLLFYWLGPERSWVWVVSSTGVRATALPPASEIEPLVASHQSAIQNALADPLAGQAGGRLYDALVRPIADQVPRGANLVIVPDGALHRLNFETLPVPGEPKRYWIEDVTIQIAPSLAMLQRASSRGREPSLLLVGNPTPRAPEFPALSYAPAEMAGVATHFARESVTTIEGERASPAAFREAGPERYSVIHFTSHAVANIENPLDSAVILSGPDQSFKLYAREVAQMPLSSELVTVSACRSAGERAYAGEGLVGFAWAFLRAGSRRVVAGLWDVDDRSTALLMDEVYARMAAGDAPATALRAAKLSLIEQGFPKPFYWAPFQLFTVVL